MKPKKENALPGVVAKVKDKTSYITPVWGKTETSSVTVTSQPGSGLSGVYELYSGRKVEIIKSPKKYEGINCIKIRVLDDNFEGYIYWTEFVNSFELVKEF
jgi:hypothetical protein